MKQSVNNLVGYTIKATDGDLGTVNEFYFDFLTLSIRFLVAKTGNWLSEQKLLIPNTLLGTTDWKTRTFLVDLTIKQVQNCFDIEKGKNNSLQQETKLFSNHTPPVYYGDVFYPGALKIVPLLPLDDKNFIKGESSSLKKIRVVPHLQNTRKATNYNIHANDGEIGHIHDYIVDDENWNIYFLIVETKNSQPGKKVLIRPFWVYHIDSDESKIYVNLSKESIKNSPEYDFAKLKYMDA